MRAIVIGPPGAGKGTQCRALSKHFSLVHISSGEMFRRVAAQQTPIATRLADLMRHGALVPDAMAIRMVRHRLSAPDCHAGFLLDGFPRTRAQALGLGRALIEDSVHLDVVVLLEVDDAVATARVTGRRTDPETGAAYHLSFAPPPAEVADRLVRREDDREEACRARLQAYHQAIDDVATLYEDRDMLQRIDGSGSADLVTRRLIAALS